MPKKVGIITGANAGIGKAATIQIAQKGYQVIMACRSVERGQKALAEIQSKTPKDAVVLKIVDLSLQNSIKQFAKEVQAEYKKIDLLIHNAAIFDITQKEAIYTDEGIEKVWATNHIGPVLMNQLLLNQIKKSEQARIITISSKGLIIKPFLKINFDDPEFRQQKYSIEKAYYHSKLAQVMYTIWLAEELANTNIMVNSIRVPAVKIDISKYPNVSSLMKKIYQLKSRFSITPEKMAEAYTYLATSRNLIGVTGKNFDENNKVIKWTNYQSNKAEIKKLMDLSLKYLS